MCSGSVDSREQFFIQHVVSETIERGCNGHLI